MKRDPSYMREILLEYEASTSSDVMERDFLGMRGSDQKRFHHVQLLCDAGLLERISQSVFRLTNQGHDFLDSIRDEGRWKKVMDRIAEHGGDWTMEVLKTVALNIFKETFSN